MEKILASLLAFVSLSAFATPDSSRTITGSLPIVCADAKTFAQTITDFKEIPMLRGLSSRDPGNGLMIPVNLVVFINPKTGTFTIAEKVDDMYCVVALGEKMEPHVEKSTL